jgi:hypothetical protein
VGCPYPTCTTRYAVAGRGEVPNRALTAKRRRPKRALRSECQPVQDVPVRVGEPGRIAGDDDVVDERRAGTGRELLAAQEPAVGGVVDERLPGRHEEALGLVDGESDRCPARSAREENGALAGSQVAPVDGAAAGPF